MVAFIDAERETYGVEPMGAVLPIAPATYFRHKAWQAYPDQRCPRAQRDAWLTTQIQRVWGRELWCLWPAQSLAATDPRGNHRSPLHGRAIDAAHGAARRRSRPDVQNDDPR